MDRRTLTALASGAVLVTVLVTATLGVARTWGWGYAVAWWAGFVGAILLARDL